MTEIEGLVRIVEAAGKWTAIAVCFLSAMRWVFRPVVAAALERWRRAGEPEDSR